MSSNVRKTRKVAIDKSLVLKDVSPLTDAQSDVRDAYHEGYNLVLYGSAGSGKSFYALYLALKDLLDGGHGYRHIYVVRSAVTTRKVGFLPGTLEEKNDPYEEPYKVMFSNMFGRADSWDVLKGKGVVELVCTSFLRGRTFDDSILIVDEIQNMTRHEAETVITRYGSNCKMILCGDTEQCDLIQDKCDVSGMPFIMEVLSRMDSIDMVEFWPEDIVRSGFVREFIEAKRQYQQELMKAQGKSEEPGRQRRRRLHKTL